jgi:hypothetical protein
VSFICRMVVGYFEPAQVYGRRMAVNRPLDSATVERLQAACDELFQVPLRLADCLTEPGVLIINDAVISDQMFQVACVAHELFGMTAVDSAHQGAVYPRPDWEPQSLDESMQPYRELRSDWDEDRVRQEAEFWHRWQTRQFAFEREVVQRVRAAAANGFSESKD